MKLVTRICLLLLCVCAALMARTAVAASLDAPEAAGMRAMGGNVYVDPDLSRDEADMAVKLLEKARKRAAIYYDELVAHPKIVFCATNDCYRDFGGVGLGFSDGSNLVISPQGRRVAIIAHELAHVELSVRIGGFDRVLALVPQWFDEGQAVMVSMAREFSEEAWMDATDDGKQAPDLNTLAGMENWVRLTGPNGENMQLTYGTAKQEVSRWFGRSGQPGFAALLRALRNNEPFASAYARIEANDERTAAVAGEAAADIASAPTGNYFMRSAW